MFCASGGGQREQTEKTLKIEKKKKIITTGHV